MITPNYDWVDNWGDRDQTQESLSGWAHPGMATTSDGRIVSCDSGSSEILIYSQDGDLIQSWFGNFTDAHGITVVNEDGNDYLWIADNGSKRLPEFSYEYPPGAENKSGMVRKYDLSGKSTLDLSSPDHMDYEHIRYSPTSIAVDEMRFGGSGDVWVSDGYGASLVHKFDALGKYILSIDGLEGSGHFSCPHGIIIDRRKTNPELYVADRANGRIQVFNLNGDYLRTFGEDLFTTPSEFAITENLMIVAELEARLAILDSEDNLVRYLFPDELASTSDGWPNEISESGDIKRPSRLRPERFNSPHGITVDESGNIYVAEWLIGGRFTKLVLN
ncbi:hypothetical protein OAJ44_01275 [Chloroflexi bacterium]|nr:hypothetical protein [Chloroflexota bacterium]